MERTGVALVSLLLGKLGGIKIVLGENGGEHGRKAVTLLATEGDVLDHEVLQHALT
jgi:hypothetical protein